MSSKKKKCITVSVAVIMVLALGLAGTFAASDSTDSDDGFGQDLNTKLFLHDDFSPDWADNVRNRDIYVENNGDTPLYVRMRLDEYMKYGNKSLINGGKENDLTTWKPHIATGEDVTDCGTEIHDYFTLQMGNAGAVVKYKPEVKNSYTEGLSDADKTAAAPGSRVVTIDKYLNASFKPDRCWILDDDGYAYWFAPLKKNQATGLLLNSIANTGLVDESYYYGINARAEAVTESDLNAWFNGTAPTDNSSSQTNRASRKAIKLLKNMSSKYMEIIPEMDQTTPKASEFDTDSDGYLTKAQYAEYSEKAGLVKALQENIKNTPVNSTVEIMNANGTKTSFTVLSKTEEKADLISTNMVHSMPYHYSRPYPTWALSNLRSWLNDIYINSLSNEMQLIISPQELKTSPVFSKWDTLDVTQDKIYILTETGIGTNQAAKNPGDTPIPESVMLCPAITDSGNAGGSWWLRSPAGDNSRASAVSCTDGTFSAGSVTGGGFGVRPAITVNLK